MDILYCDYCWQIVSQIIVVPLTHIEYRLCPACAEKERERLRYIMVFINKALKKLKAEQALGPREPQTS